MGSFSLLSAAARRLEGKVALITGGASGIGEATTKLFSKHGAKVVIAYIQDELGHSVCKDLSPQSTSFIHCDVTNETDVENAVNLAVSKFGKLDIMVNNAGISEGAKTDILEIIKSKFEQVIGSAPHGYTSSKHGVVGLMKNTAVDLGRFGIRVNCMSPYTVATPMVKDFFKLDNDGVHSVYSNLKGQVLKAEDVAEAALYLGSDESKCVSGHNLLVDGGFSIVNAGFIMYA